MSGKTLKSLSLLLAVGLLIGGGAAINFEQLGDELCKYQLTVFLAPICAEELDKEISSTQPDNVRDDIYSKAIVQQDRREQLVKEQRSHLNQTFGMSLSEAKITTIEALNNGTSQDDAQQIGLGNVRDYYAIQQVKTLSQQDREAELLRSVSKKVNDTDGLTYSDVFVERTDSAEGIYYWDCEPSNTNPDDIVNFDFKQQEIILHNRTIRNYTSVNATVTPITSSETYDCRLLSPSRSDKGRSLKVNSSVGEFATIVNGSSHQETLDLVAQFNENAENNVIEMNSEIYSKFDKGDLSVADMLGPLETLKLASTSYNQTGFYSYIATSLEQAGYASNDSYAFHVQWNNTDAPVKKAYGQLFATEGNFNNTLEVNKTYNASGKTVFFTHNTENGKAKETSLNGTFKILSMTDKKTGEKVNVTKIQSTDFYTDSTQDMKKQLEQHRNKTKKLQTGGIGGIIDDTTGWIADAINSLFPDVPEISGDAVIGIGAAVLLLVILA
jgi:hypothetical protein